MQGAKNAAFDDAQSIVFVGDVAIGVTNDLNIFLGGSAELSELLNLRRLCGGKAVGGAFKLQGNANLAPFKCQTSKVKVQSSN